MDGMRYKTNKNNDTNEKMYMDCTYTEKAIKKYRNDGLNWNPQGKKKVGRPKNTWKSSILREIEKAGYTWLEVK
jgi:hypothetical protein